MEQIKKHIANLIEQSRRDEQASLNLKQTEAERLQVLMELKLHLETIPELIADIERRLDHIQATSTRHRLNISHEIEKINQAMHAHLDILSNKIDSILMYQLSTMNTYDRFMSPDEAALIEKRLKSSLKQTINVNVHQKGGTMSDTLNIGGDVKNVAYKNTGNLAQATDQATATATQISGCSSVYETGLKHIEQFVDEMLPIEALTLEQDWQALKPLIEQAEESGEATDGQVEQVEGFFQHLVRFSYEKRWEIVEGFTDVFTPLPSKLVSIPGRYLEEKLRGIQTGEA